MTGGIRHDDLRRRNRAMVIAAVRRASQPSRTEIASATGLSHSTISAISSDLIAEGILTETKGSEPITARRGRPQVALSLNPGAGTVIVAHDEDFHEKLPYLFPHTDAKSWFEGPREGRREAAFRNGSLQGAYVILAARALGLDTGPMSGFNNAKVDEAFFAGTAIKSNFLINLGHGDTSKLFPRSPRLSFDEAARIE